jgi:hypothetical protein
MLTQLIHSIREIEGLVEDLETLPINDPKEIEDHPFGYFFKADHVTARGVLVLLKVEFQREAGCSWDSEKGAAFVTAHEMADHLETGE